MAAVTSVPLVKAMPMLPMLWGDGIHDDTAGLQALFDYAPVDIRADMVRLLEGRLPIIDGGKFKISRGLVLRWGRVVEMKNFSINSDEVVKGPMFQVETNAVLAMGHCTVNLCAGTWKDPTFMTTLGGQVYVDPGSWPTIKGVG